LRRAALLLVLCACGGPAPVTAPASPPPTTAAPTTTAPAPTTPPATTPPPATRAPATARPTPRPTPAATAVRYAFPIRGCRVTYGRAHHDYPATDMFAPRGCAFVSPVDGRVDEVSYTDEWDGSTNRGADRGGLFVSVVGTDGVRYYGSHLASVAPGIRPGVRVRAGDRLGAVGTTGSARGTPPHLHLGISWPTRPGVWWVRRGMVAPWPYLDSWRAGGHRSPAAEVRAKRAETGTVPPCPSYC
jgi:murein DD-endopeptidase MepM/ murein hydrolase activator NlpD